MANGRCTDISHTILSIFMAISREVFPDFNCLSISFMIIYPAIKVPVRPAPALQDTAIIPCGLLVCTDLIKFSNVDASSPDL